MGVYNVYSIYINGQITEVQHSAIRVCLFDLLRATNKYLNIRKKIFYQSITLRSLAAHRSKPKKVIIYSVEIVQLFLVSWRVK